MCYSRNCCKSTENTADNCFPGMGKLYLDLGYFTGSRGNLCSSRPTTSTTQDALELHEAICMTTRSLGTMPLVTRGGVFQSRVARVQASWLLRERSLHSYRRHHQTNTATEFSDYSCTVVHVRGMFAEGWKVGCDQLVWDFCQSIAGKNVGEVR